MALRRASVCRKTNYATAGGARRADAAISGASGKSASRVCPVRQRRHTGAVSTHKGTTGSAAADMIRLTRRKASWSVPWSAV